MRNRAVQIAGGGQRAAQMAMALGPIGRMRQQPLVSRRGLLMTAAIAEQPGAEMRCIGVIWGPDEGAAAAFRPSSRRPLWNSASAKRQFNRAAAGSACPEFLRSC